MTTEATVVDLSDAELARIDVLATERDLPRDAMIAMLVRLGLACAEETQKPEPPSGKRSVGR